MEGEVHPLSLVFYTVWFCLTFALFRMYYCIVHITYLFNIYITYLFFIILVVRVLIAPWVGEKRIFNCSVCLAHIAELTNKVDLT